ncbi:MAG: hypothetical protein HW389_1530 [Bacteroidetes bacterium]|nr:hypothetical protein [Bacteroidota bacterium]
MKLNEMPTIPKTVLTNYEWIDQQVPLQTMAD